MILPTEAPEEESHLSKVELLLPHVALAALCLVILGLNFWCYRRNHHERYKRKVEKLVQDMMSRTPRRVTSMMRYSDPKGVVYNVTAHHQHYDSCCSGSAGMPSFSEEHPQLDEAKDKLCTTGSDSPLEVHSNRSSKGVAMADNIISLSTKRAIGLFSVPAYGGKKKTLPAI